MAHILGKLKKHEKWSYVNLNGRDIHRALTCEPTASLRPSCETQASFAWTTGSRNETLLGFLEAGQEQGPGIP